jgi:predicted dinucleotide-binding enzyme
MRITVIGAGAIGGNLAHKLSAAGHDVQVADARGPAAVLTSGARAVAVESAVQDRDVIILSIPYDRVPELAGPLAHAPSDAIIVDTSNYYPHLNGTMDGVGQGQVETARNAELLGRPVIKAWNAALAETQRTKGVPAGTPGRIAIPVAGDSPEARQVVMRLVDDTGFDPYDAGILADSWRQQPMGPAYCTELTHAEMGPALTAADRDKDLAVRDSMLERFSTLGEAFTHDDVVEMNRAAHR